MACLPENTEVCICVYASLCVCMSLCMCLSLVPSKPKDLMYVSSTENSMTLSWKQSGNVDYYIIKQNSTPASHESFTYVSNVSGVDDVSVSATVSNLLISGAVYCISVTAVSGHLHSDEVELCNYTGMMRIDDDDYDR